MHHRRGGARIRESPKACLEASQKLGATAAAEEAPAQPPVVIVRETNAQVVSRMCAASLALFEKDADWKEHLPTVRHVLKKLTEHVALHEPTPEPDAKELLK